MTTLQAQEQRIRDAYARRPPPSTRYSYASPGHLFAQQDRSREVLRLLKDNGLMPLDGRDILEVGCGSGGWLRDLAQWGASPERLTGVDILSGPLAYARRCCAPQVGLMRASAAGLPFPDASFDVVLQAVVFSSILDDRLQEGVAAEMLRVLRPGGTIIWFDFYVDNPRNNDVRGVPRKTIGRLFPGCRIELRRTNLAPPIMRPAASTSWLAAYLLARVPLLCTHYLGTIRAPA